MTRRRPQLMTTHKDLESYRPECALLGIAIQAPDRVGEVMDCVDLDLWGMPNGQHPDGLPVLRDCMRELARLVQTEGPNAVDFTTFAMHVINRRLPITARALSDLLDDVMPSTSVRPHAEAIVRNARDWLVRESIDSLHIAADDGDDIAPHVRRLQEVGSIGEQAVRPMLDAMDETLEGMQRAWDGDVRRWSTGLEVLDSHLSGGLVAPQMVIVGGRPGMGKTALGIQIADQAARDGARVHVYSGEMDASQIGGRIFSLHADATTDELQNPSQGTMQRLVDQLHRMRERGYRMQVDDRASRSWSEVAAGALRTAYRYGGLDMLVVDYLQLLRVDAGSTEYATFTEASKGAKGLAKELGCVVVLLCQLNREGAKRAKSERRPKTTDIRATGQLEQDSDVILFPYRAVVDDESEPHDYAVMGIAKYRQGPSGMWPQCLWDGPRTRFTDMALFGDL